ncbi:peptide deformylase [Azospirillum baldaniorum]|uniref:Peptide deformylase n=4 Tax=Azospirillum TaxID=191 RepID=A0A9P1JNY4_9PROT|nr:MULTISPECIES: peptide deformylase [Azospirillum]TWA78969.1 peptide deformylase [Azospirillum brasilense]AWJ90741.1 peptide deformylase [Azospirillum baldaniorum]MBK3802603.1 peptide deformylase [Azospirillum argentinense]NUB08760.1 peptide deformylase [Azospirillum baldaniorum]PNQ98860.1 peptide deformylase [Azospirillum argentinense]
MAVLDILVAPHPVLKQKAKPVDKVDARIAKLMDDMVETMYAAKGIGLAAPQIGILERVIVVDVHDKDEKPNPIRLANPEIVWKSDETSVCEEGCLSVPDQYAEVTRPSSVRVRYLDETNETREIEADGMLATCIQHEIDHLNGVLFVDYLSMLKRNMILRKVQKMQRA